VWKEKEERGEKKKKHGDGWRWSFFPQKRIKGEERKREDNGKQLW
jgi:hypothetical protein